jgi:mRNA interferase HigB
MRINNKKALNDFKQSHPDAVTHINAWQAEVTRAEWKTPNELKQQYGNASILKDRKVVFNIRGNKYRLLVQISYKSGIVFVRDIVPHEVYDEWNLR